MSHVTALKTTIHENDLALLPEACRRIGVEFRQDQKSFNWYKTWVNDYHGQDAAFRHGVNPEEYGKCDHAIGIPDRPDAYEIGLVKDKEKPGHYKLVMDNWAGGRGLCDKVGKNGGLVLQSLMQLKAEQAAAKAGFVIKSSDVCKQDGFVDITLVKKGGVVGGSGPLSSPLGGSSPKKLY